eukprot:461284_1
MVGVRRFSSGCIVQETRLILLSKRIIHQSGYINQLTDTHNQIHSHHRENQKKLRGDHDVRQRIQMPKGIDKEVRSLLHQHEPHNIYGILKDHHNHINHPGTYALAMQKCKKSSNWKAVHGIMKLCLHSNVQPHAELFNIFIDCMARWDAPQLAIQYFNLMTHKYHLIPDVITFTSLIKSFRRQAKCKDGEWYWNIMLSQYNTQPNELTYAEMLSVYSRAHQKQNATALFDEYLQKVKRNELPKTLPVFGAYLNVFSRCGDAEGMERVIQLIQQNAFELNNVIIADIMRGYLTARQYRKCIETLDEWIGDGHKPTLPMMMLKCVNLQFRIKCDDGISFGEKEKLYLEIEDVIHCQLEQYGLAKDQYITVTQLSAAVLLYRQTNPMKLVQIFESMLQQNHIGYEQYDAKNKNTLIDLHCFNKWNAQFILRYVFGFKLKDILKTGDEKLYIICGKGKHTEGDGNNHGRLQQFIQDELSQWKPSIASRQDETNKGRLVIDRSELTAYLEEDINCAKEKLMNLSSEWYNDDPGKQSSEDSVTHFVLCF